MRMKQLAPSLEDRCIGSAAKGEGVEEGGGEGWEGGEGEGGKGEKGR